MATMLRDSYTSPYLLSDEQILALGIEEHHIELFRRKHYQDSFGIDTWYDALAAETFKTAEIVLNPDEISGIIMLYKLEFERTRRMKRLPEEGPPPVMSEEQQKALQSVSASPRLPTHFLQRIRGTETDGFDCHGPAGGQNR